VTSPSGHEKGDGKSIDNSVDGRTDTKWCIDGPGKLVVWQTELPEPRTVASYAINRRPLCPRSARPCVGLVVFVYLP
jgi:hypothetical protein